MCHAWFMSHPARPDARQYVKPYVLPSGLDLLLGQTTGVVRLPRHLDWSGNAVYNLNVPGRLVDLYRTVIIEAATPEDLHAYLEATTLRRLWAQIWLPPVVREAWQARFDDLPTIGFLAAPA